LTGEDGIATRLESYLDSVLGSGNLIASREAGLEERLEGLQDDRARLDARLAQIEERYVKQFSALDSLVAQLNQTSSFLEQQLSNTPLARK
jgi:flagellar hook-associated protein 2